MKYMSVVKNEISKEEMMSDLDSMHFELGNLIDKFGGKATYREQTAQESLAIVKDELIRTLDRLKTGDVEGVLRNLVDAINLCEVK